MEAVCCTARVVYKRITLCDAFAIAIWRRGARVVAIEVVELKAVRGRVRVTTSLSSSHASGSAESARPRAGVDAFSCNRHRTDTSEGMGCSEAVSGNWAAAVRRH